MKTNRLILTLAITGLSLTTGAMAAGRAGKSSGPTQESRAAMKAYHQQVLSIYDENDDGVLDDVERSVLRADIESGAMVAPPGFEGRGRHGRGGPPPEIVEQYDTDGDGVLSAEEHAVIKADIASGKLVPPGPRGGGRRGGRPDQNSDSDEG